MTGPRQRRDSTRTDDAPAGQAAESNTSIGNRATAAAASRGLPVAPSLAAGDLPMSAWTAFEDERDRRNVDDPDAPTVGPYRGEIGGAQQQPDGSHEFEADARAEVADTDLWVVRMGRRPGRWATYPHRDRDSAIAEAESMARRFAIARADEAAHGFRPGGDDPRHELALPEQWSDSGQSDQVWRNAEYTEVAVFRIPRGTPYIASQVAPQPEGEDLAAGIRPRMWRGGAMQIQLADSDHLEEELVVPIDTVPTPDVAATAHSVTEQASFERGVERSGAIVETDLPSGERITGTDVSERVLGIPTRRERGLETSVVDPFELARSVQRELRARIIADEAALRDLDAESDPSPEQQAQAATIRSRLRQRRSDFEQLERHAEVTRVRAIVDRNDLDIGEEPRRVTEGRRSSTALRGGTVERSTTETATGGDTTLESTSQTAVGVTGVTSSASDRLTTTDRARGSRRTTTQSQTTQADWSGGSRTTSTERSEADLMGTTTTERSSSTTSVRAGGGRLTAAQSRTTGSELRYGDETLATESTSQRSASLIHGDQGSGVGVAGSRSSSSTRNGVRLGTRRGGDGSFTVNVEDLGTHPPTYRVTTTVHLGASVGGDVARERRPEQRGATGSAGVTGQVSGDLVYTRTLPETEARRYLGDLDEVASGRTVDGRPEFGLVARARALRLQGDADVGALVSGRTAREMSDGETIELDIGFGGDIALGGGAQSGGGARTRSSIGVSGSVGASGGRRIRIARRGGDLIVTVTVRSETRRSGSGTLGHGAASMTMGASESDGATSAVAFRLDVARAETTEARLDEISGLMTEPALIAYADRHADIVQSRTGGASRSEGSTVGLGVAGVDATIGQTSNRSSSVSTGQGRVTGSQSGGQTTTGSIGVLGQTVLQGSTTSSVDASVSESDEGAADIDVTISRTDSESDYGVGLDALERDVGEQDAIDTAADVATTGGRGLLDRILGATSAILTQYELDSDQFDRFVRRARNRRRWGRMLVWPPEASAAWEQLRGQLTSPRPRAEWSEADTSDDDRFANRMAQATALADFMSRWGERGGHDAVVKVLREWSSEDLGTLWEWPESLRATRVRYERTKSEVDGLNRWLEGRLPPAGSDGGAQLEQARSHCNRLRSNLERVRREIAACADFEQHRAQLEMEMAINRQRRLVSRRLQRYENMATERATLPRDEEEATPGQLVADRQRRHESLEEAEQACLPEDERTVDPEVVERVQTLEGALENQRRAYNRLLNEAYALIPEDAGGGASWFWEGSAGEATDKLFAAARLHEEWINQILTLRTLYQAGGVDRREWKVKPDADSSRRRLDPDIDRLCRYYRGIQEWMTESWLLIPTLGWPDTIARWQRRSRY